MSAAVPLFPCSPQGPACPDAVGLCSHTEKHDEIVKDGTDLLSQILSEQNERFKSGLFLSVSLPVSCRVPSSFLLFAVTQTRESVLDANMLGKVSRLGVERVCACVRVDG